MNAVTTTLTEDQLALAEVTLDFAQEQLAPTRSPGTGPSTSPST